MEPRELGMLGCETLFGPVVAGQIEAMIDGHSDAGCPCKRGCPCPLLPVSSSGAEIPAAAVLNTL